MGDINVEELMGDFHQEIPGWPTQKAQMYLEVAQQPGAEKLDSHGPYMRELFKFLSRIADKSKKILHYGTQVRPWYQGNKEDRKGLQNHGNRSVDVAVYVVRKERRIIKKKRGKPSVKEFKVYRLLIAAEGKKAELINAVGNPQRSATQLKDLKEAATQVYDRLMAQPDEFMTQTAGYLIGISYLGTLMLMLRRRANEEVVTVFNKNLQNPIVFDFDRIPPNELWVLDSLDHAVLEWLFRILVDMLKNVKARLQNAPLD